MYPTIELMAHAVGPAARVRPAFFPAPVFHDAALSVELYDIQQMLRTSAPDLATEERLLDVLGRLVDRHAETRGGACRRIRPVASGR